MEQAVTLGDKVKDRVTGFTGIAVSRIEYLNGCTQYCIRPPVDDKGQLVSSEWFDSQQVEVVERGACAVQKKETGGPVQHSPRATYRG